MAASTGAYQTILAEAQAVDPESLTYEQRSQMAASQRGSAVIRAQAISTPVKAPVTKKTAKTAATVEKLKPKGAPSSAQMAKLKKAAQVSKGVKNGVAASIAKTVQSTISGSFAGLNAAFSQPKRPSPPYPITGGFSSAVTPIAAASVAGNMSLSSSSDY
jgi:hypothetical protein